MINFLNLNTVVGSVTVMTPANITSKFPSGILKKVVITYPMTFIGMCVTSAEKDIPYFV